MSISEKPKRKYNSSRRKEQARETRRQIGEAARSLFDKNGYGGTTINAIAEAAGVSPESVYAIFGSKHKILWYLLDISIGGDEQPIGILGRPGPQQMMQDTDQRRQIRMFSGGIAEIMSRGASIFEVMRSAAKTEDDIAALLTHMQKERLKNMNIVTSHLAKNGALRPGLEIPQAAEIIWTVTSADVYLLLTRDLHYSQEQYVTWLADTLTRLLLP